MEMSPPYSGGELEVSPESAEQETPKIGLGLRLHETIHVWQRAISYRLGVVCLSSGLQYVPLNWASWWLF